MIHLIYDITDADDFMPVIDTAMKRRYYPTHRSKLINYVIDHTDTAPEPQPLHIRQVLITNRPESFIYDVETYYLPYDLLGDPLPVDDTLCKKLTKMPLAEWRAYCITRQDPGVKDAKKRSLARTLDVPAFPVAVAQTEIVGDINYEVVTDSTFQQAIDAMAAAELYGVDIETNRLDPLSGMVCATVSVREGQCYYFPSDLAVRLSPHIDWNKVTGHGLKYDIQGLGIFPRRVRDDTHIMAHVSGIMVGQRGLKARVDAVFGFKMLEFTDIVPEGQSIADIDEDIRVFYACSDADWSRRLCLHDKPLMPPESMPIYELQMQLIPILAEMEFNGIKTDKTALDALYAEQNREAWELALRIMWEIGHPINIHPSSPQLGKALFEELGFKATKFNKKGPSTAEDVIKDIDHPFVRYVLRFRELNKLMQTYTVPLRYRLHPLDSRIHPQFNNGLTDSGRLSAQNPNTQNTPKTATYRNCIIADVGNSIVQNDYDQLELRMIAGMSGGRTMRSVFESGGDIHAFTASIIHGCDVADVTSAMRQDGKKGNFAIGFGAGERKIVEIGLAPDLVQAKYVRDQLFIAFADEMDWIMSTREVIKRERRSVTLMGRIRSFGDYVPIDSVEREGFNHIIQGSGVELVFQGMVKARPIWEQFNAILINQVHDEVLHEVRTAWTADFQAAVIPALEDVNFVLPMKVSGKVGAMWQV